MKKLSKHQSLSKSALSVSIGCWECLCYVQNCQRSVRDNRYTLQHKKEITAKSPNLQHFQGITRRRDKAVLSPALFLLKPQRSAIHSLASESASQAKPHSPLSEISIFFFLQNNKLYLFLNLIAWAYCFNILILLSNSEAKEKLLTKTDKTSS